MDRTESRTNARGPDFDPVAPVLGQATGDAPPPWELIDTGRYQPRRIKGSCLGRALG
jgi:hypothetical protein